MSRIVGTEDCLEALAGSTHPCRAARSWNRRRERGGHQPGKPVENLEKSGNLKVVREKSGKVEEVREKSTENVFLPVCDTAVVRETQDIHKWRL